jgi:DHA1 family bicyclomycin/chloramphenicol resistance-like MFS transporter
MPSISPQRLAVVLGGLIAVGPLAIDTYLPAMPAMAASFAVSVPDVELSLSLYMLGTGVGQLVGGPMSDHIGRRKVGTAGLSLYLLCSLLIAASSSLGALYVLRFVQALGGGATIVICAASVRDHFEGREAARVLTLIGLVMLTAPLLAPVIGTVLIQISVWRAIFVFLAIYSALMLVLLQLGLPRMPAVRRSQASVAEILKGYGRVLGHRRGFGLILTNALAFATMFAFITDSAFVYMEHYGVSTTLFPVVFGANVVLMIAFNRLNVRLLHRHEPEAIMTVSLAVQAVAVAALALITSWGHLPLWLAVPLFAIAVSTVALIIPNAIASFIHYFPHDSGSATAINGTLQFTLAGASGGVFALFHDQSLVPMTLTMVLCSAGACSALLWARGGGHGMIH